MSAELSRIMTCYNSQTFKGEMRLSIYKPYPQANLIREWDKLIKLKKEEVIELYEQWKVIKVENDEIHRKQSEEKYQNLNEIVDFLKTKGIDVHKYKTKGFFKDKNGYQAWFKKNVYDVISNKYPYFSTSIPTAHMTKVTVDGIELYNNQSPTNIVELYDRIVWQYKSKKREIEKVDKLLIASIKYAAEHEIEIEDLSHKDIIAMVDEFAKNKYLEENVPEGTEIYLKHACYECSTYIMGEHRCSCGNRRISIEVEGNIIEGYYHYPEAY